MINFGVLKRANSQQPPERARQSRFPYPEIHLTTATTSFVFTCLTRILWCLIRIIRLSTRILKKWQEAHEADETLTRDQFQQDHTVLRANETNVFNIRVEQGDDTDTTDDDLERQKRTHQTTCSRHSSHYSIEQLRKVGILLCRK